jgi:hypothetical protein
MTSKINLEANFPKTRKLMTALHKTQFVTVQGILFSTPEPQQKQTAKTHEQTHSTNRLKNQFKPDFSIFERK